MLKNKIRSKAIQRMKKVIKSKQCIIAESINGYILYHQKDYDKVIEGLGFVVPMPVARFKSYKKAYEFLEEVSRDRSPFYEEEELYA